MPKVYVVIPFKDEPGLTNRVIGLLKEHGGFDHCLLYDNGSQISTLDEIEDEIDGDPRFEVVPAMNMGIYAMWNAGLKEARERAEDPYVAFLNNDITFRADFLNLLYVTLLGHPEVGIAYPDYDLSVETGFALPRTRETHGTYKDGGMCGWAFMLRSSLVEEGLQYVDENLLWWYGDDFMEREVHRVGYKVVRVEGNPVDHLNEATASNGKNDWTHSQKSRDTAYWNATYC